MSLREFEKEIVNDVHTISGYSENEIKNMIDFLFLNQAMDLYKKNIIRIPFWGTLTVTYEGEEYILGKKQAKVSCEFHPSDLLKLIVGEKIDNKATFIENILIDKIKNSVLSVLID